MLKSDPFLTDISVSGAKKKRTKKDQKPTERKCDWPDCSKPGEHKAPRGRDALNKHYWFCVDHVREYNKSWNFFEGMSDGEVQDYIKASHTGHRPTWKIGDNKHPSHGKHFQDAYELLEDADAPSTGPVARKSGPVLSKLDKEALTVLNLEQPVTGDEVKAQYKQLVKRFHPDLNGGDRTTEERLKQVIQAYNQLKKSGALDRLK